MAGFFFDSKHIEAPKITNSEGMNKAILSVNPFGGLSDLFNDYLQGQHNIGVAEAENSLLNADTREATLAIMDRLRKSGITETQLKEADAQGILDKNTEMDFRKAQEEQQRLTTEIAKNGIIIT